MGPVIVNVIFQNQSTGSASLIASKSPPPECPVAYFHAPASWFAIYPGVFTSVPITASPICLNSKSG